MTRDVITVPRDMTLRDLEALFEDYDFSAFPVMEAGRIASCGQGTLHAHLGDRASAAS